MPLRPALFAAFAALALPPVATAGPIEFDYTATVNRFYLLPLVSIPSSSLSFDLTPEGNVSLPASGGSVELGTVRLTPGPVPPYSLIYPFERPTGPTSASMQFAVFVTVTDAQGRSTELPIYSSTEERWVPGPGAGEWVPVHSAIRYGMALYFGDNAPPYYGENVNSWATVLGPTRYTLTARGAEDDLVGVYTLSAAPVATPEPGTLALAALGLLPLALRRRAKAAACAGSH
jgi:hypothetical protein